MRALAVVGHVERNDRRAFGAPVSFERLDAELREELLAHRVIQFAAADRDVAQMRKIRRFDAIDAIYDRCEHCRTGRNQRDAIGAAKRAELAVPRSSAPKATRAPVSAGSSRVPAKLIALETESNRGGSPRG
jgi:hypothetical protein